MANDAYDPKMVDILRRQAKAKLRDEVRKRIPELSKWPTNELLANIVAMLELQLAYQEEIDSIREELEIIRRRLDEPIKVYGSVGVRNALEEGAGTTTLDVRVVR